MTKEASNIPDDVLHFADEDVERGVDPDVLDDTRLFVPGTSKLRFEDEARVMVESGGVRPAQVSETDVAASRIPTPKTRKLTRPVEMPRRDGPNNPYNQDVTSREAQSGLTVPQVNRQREINAAGRDAGRAILDKIDPPKP